MIYPFTSYHLNQIKKPFSGPMTWVENGFTLNQSLRRHYPDQVNGRDSLPSQPIFSSRLLHIHNRLIFRH